jgi:ABC-2 type transport system permease protein
MEPQSRPNDDQTQYQDQYWNGPAAGHWLVHEHRDEAMAVAALLAGWTLGYAGLYSVVGLRAGSPEALTALVPPFVPISLLSTAYIPAELLPGWVRSAAAVNPYSHVVDTVRAAMTGTPDAGQLAAGLAAVVAAVALTQLAAARRFARLVHRA